MTCTAGRVFVACVGLALYGISATAHAQTDDPPETPAPEEDVLAEALAEDAVDVAPAPEPVEDPPSEDPPDEVSPEELRALEEALAADLADATPAPAMAASPSTSTNQVALDIAFILDVVGAWFSDEDPLQGGGHDPRVTGFNLQQLELSVGASVDPFFRFDANLVFGLFGVELEEAYASTLALPHNLKVRAGQFLTRFGRLNNTHPHAWSFIDQPIVNSKFLGGEGSRGLGAELSWLTPLPWYVELVGTTTMADGECCARSFYGGDNLGVHSPADLLYTTRVAQFFPLGDSLSLLWGLSAQFGPNASGHGNRTEIYGSDLYLRYRPPSATSRMSLSLQLEGMFRTRQVPDDVLQDFGGRGELIWEISPRFETGVRHELVSGVANDPLDPEWTSMRHRSTAQFTFRPSHFSRLRFQTSADMPSFRDAPIYAAMLALEVLVGAHGAHAF